MREARLFIRVIHPFVCKILLANSICYVDRPNIIVYFLFNTMLKYIVFNTLVVLVKPKKDKLIKHAAMKYSIAFMLQSLNNFICPYFESLMGTPSIFFKIEILCF